MDLVLLSELSEAVEALCEALPVRPGRLAASYGLQDGRVHEAGVLVDLLDLQLEAGRLARLVDGLQVLIIRTVQAHRGIFQAPLFFILK